MEHQGERTPHEPPPTAVGRPAADGLGTRAHVQHTLERARAAVAASGERAQSSEQLIARAELLVGESEALRRHSSAFRAQLRASVSAYVRHLRDAGTPSERMVVLVKGAVRDFAPRDLEATEARALMDDVVRWSIEAYFHAP